jgi:hypothetical protein
MIDLEDIKKNEIITIGAFVSTIYAFGYISHIIRNHLLGIDLLLTELEILTNGADFLLSSFIDSIKFVILEPILKLNSFINSNFLFSTILIICFLGLFVFKSKINTKWFRKTQTILIIFASFNILFFQIKLLDIKNILQASSFNYIEDVRINDYTGIPQKKVSDIYYEQYILSHNSNSLFSNYFSPTEESAKKRLNHYSSVFIFIIMFISILFKILKGNQKRKRKMHCLDKFLFLFIVINILFLPSTYAIIGNSINYQNCNITTKDNNLYSGILVANSVNDLVLYSKYDNFKLSYITKSTVSSKVILNKQHLFSSEYNIRNFIISKHKIVDGKTYVELDITGFLYVNGKFIITITNRDSNKENIIENLKINNNILTFHIDSEVKRIRVKIADINKNENDISPKVSTAINDKVAPIKNDKKKKN